MQTEAEDLRLMQLDVLGHPSFANGAPGRAGNGNAVLTGFAVRVRSLQDPTQQRELDWSWMWVDFAQANEDYSLERAGQHGPNKGWALGTHQEAGDRMALLLAAKPFGYPGGTEVEVELRFESPYADHSFGHVRVDFSPFPQAALERLPVHAGRWYHAGPFPIRNGAAAYQTPFGPETAPALDYTATFEADGPIHWQYRGDWADGTVHELASGVNVHYVAREIYSATDRTLDVSIGSDDGFAIFVNGEVAAEREVPRGCAPDQDRVTLPLRAGRNELIFKVINTGGAAGFFYRAVPDTQLLSTDLVSAVVDRSFRSPRGSGLGSALGPRLAFVGVGGLSGGHASDRQLGRPARRAGGEHPTHHGDAGAHGNARCVSVAAWPVRHARPQAAAAAGGARAVWVPAGPAGWQRGYAGRLGPLVDLP